MTEEGDSREELVAQATTEYGIDNADDMSTAQLKAEIAAIDKQHPDAQEYLEEDRKVKSRQQRKPNNR